MQPESLSIRQVLTGSVIARILVGWASLAFLTSSLSPIHAGLPSPALATALLTVIAVILLCSTGVVHQAEGLAHRLGDPYGTLILSLSNVAIEVILISAVMLSPGDHPTIGRDSIMAVSHIILSLVVGVAILAHSRTHGPVTHNRRGATAYLVLLITFSILAFLLPTLIGRAGSYTPVQAIFIAAIIIVAYGYFLYRQMFVVPEDFQEVGEKVEVVRTDGAGLRRVVGTHRVELVTRVVVLLVTVIPIVLLSHEMAVLMDEAVMRLGAPIALSGFIIAAIVFLPETLTTLRAALSGESQRVVNLCHGALLSTLGLSIPSILIIGLITGGTVTLGAAPLDLVMLGVTLAVSAVAFTRERVRRGWGIIALMVFAAYMTTMFF